MTKFKPKMGDVIDVSKVDDETILDIVDDLCADGAIIAFNYVPDFMKKRVLCWTECNTLEFDTFSQHFATLTECGIKPRLVEVDEDGNLYDPFTEPAPTEQCNRTAYADNINYYKRIIQQATFKVNKITEQQAYQKLGYWEGRYDELTTGDKV